MPPIRKRSSLRAGSASLAARVRASPADASTVGVRGVHIAAGGDGSHPRVRILVADDNAFMRVVLGRLLLQIGYAAIVTPYILSN